MAAQDKTIIPIVIGKGENAYIDAKRWIEDNYPDITSSQYTQACQLAAQMAEI